MSFRNFLKTMLRAYAARVGGGWNGWQMANDGKKYIFYIIIIIYMVYIVSFRFLGFSDWLFFNQSNFFGDSCFLLTTANPNLALLSQNFGNLDKTLQVLDFKRKIPILVQKTTMFVLHTFLKLTKSTT